MTAESKIAHSNAAIRVASNIPGASNGAGAIRFDSGAVRACLLVFAGYYLGAKIGLAFTFQPHPVSVMWPPNAILLAALLLARSRLWPWLLLAAFPSHLLAEWQSGVPLTMILCWFVSNCCEALIGAAGTRVLIGYPTRLDSLRAINILFICAGFLAPFLSSFVDSGFVSLNHWGNQTYWTVWRMRLCSNIFANLTLVPVAVLWGAGQNNSLLKASPRRLLEAGLVFGGLVLLTVTVFCWQKPGPAAIPTLLYAPFPFLLWIAVRFGPRGTSTGIVAVAVLAIWGVVHGRGPLGSLSPEQNALSIQLFFTIITITLMLLATSLGERAKAEERFTKAFRSSPDPIIITHIKDGHIVEVNERWEAMFGYARDETKGRTLFDLNICALGEDRDKLMSHMSARERWQDLELCVRTREGQARHTLTSADSEEIGNEQCLILTIRDITDRKRAEEAQQNLAHASRLAIVGELTAMVAHEINQPLGAILSHADAARMLLETRNPPLNVVRQIIAEIRKNDLRADDAIRRIRALLRKREMQMQPVNLNETIADVLRLVAGDALKRRILILTDFGFVPLVLADRVYLQQVLLNLLVNGMHAMNDTHESNRQIIVRTNENGNDFAQVTLIDSGHGIPPDKLSEIFDSFFTTKKEGMGLGLSIARTIIEAHQGRIWAENNVDAGASFHFTVPLVKKPQSKDPEYLTFTGEKV